MVLLGAPIRPEEGGRVTYFGGRECERVGEEYFGLKKKFTCDVPKSSRGRKRVDRVGG